MPSPTERRTVQFAGQVQGVGFRFTTRNVAQGYDVKGFVQNLPDGDVLLVAEGEPGELDRFLAALREQMSGYIRQEQTDRSAPTGEFTDFRIRH
jgi:acylphosphatase